MPGAAACVEATKSKAIPAKSTGRIRITTVKFFLFKWLIFALLRHDYDFRHQTAKVFSVIRQVVQVCGVEEVSACGDARTIENDVQRLSASQGDRIGKLIHVIACLVA